MVSLRQRAVGALDLSLRRSGWKAEGPEWVAAGCHRWWFASEWVAGSPTATASADELSHGCKLEVSDRLCDGPAVRIEDRRAVIPAEHAQGLPIEDAGLGE